MKKPAKCPLFGNGGKRVKKKCHRGNTSERISETAYEVFLKRKSIYPISFSPLSIVAHNSRGIWPPFALKCPSEREVHGANSCNSWSWWDFPCSPLACSASFWSLGNFWSESNEVRWLKCLNHLTVGLSWEFLLSRPDWDPFAFNCHQKEISSRVRISP